MTNNNLLSTKLMQYQEKVMRISKMITLKRNALILYQNVILSTNSLTKCMEISLENLCLKIILSFKGPTFQNSIKIGTKGVYRRGAILPGLQCSVFHGNFHCHHSNLQKQKVN